MGTLTLLGGPPGVGKSTVAPLLAERLAPCAWVDADDLWRIHPFEVTAATKAIVESNLTHHLRQFLVAGYPHVFAVWVLHREDLIERLLAPLRPLAAAVHVIHLTADPEVLRGRASQEPTEPRSIEQVITRQREIARLPYPRIDTSRSTPAQVADAVWRHVSRA